jgi:HSP20 family molecular chaperone IbpA
MAIVKWRKNYPTFWPEFYDEFINWPELSDSKDMDIFETDDTVVVEASVPGVAEDDVEVTVEGNVLTINASSEESQEEKDKKKTIYKSSRKSSFSYSTSLPRSVDASKAEAEVVNGVVKITVPKSEVEKPKRIEVKKKK